MPAPLRRSLLCSAVGALLALAPGCSSTPPRGPGGNPGPGDDAGTPIGGDLDGGGGATDLSVSPPPSGDLGGADLSNPGPPQGCSMPLTIQPADDLVYVDGTHTFTVDYHVLCGALDVSSRSVLTVNDASLGSFNGATFTTAVAADGTSTVRAAYGPSTAQTSLTVKPTSVVIGPNTPQNAPGLFGGAGDPGLAPTWVYPADGVLVPPNLSELEFQFLPAGNQLFELRFQGAGLDLSVYTVCNAVGSGCSFELDAPTWLLLSTVARDATVNVTLRGTGMNRGNVGTSSSIRVRFAREDITGGLYYWAASDGSIYRYDFGLRGQTGEQFVKGNVITCAGCHALSRDGRRMAVGYGIPGSSMKVEDVASQQVLFAQSSLFGNSTFESFFADGSKVLTNEGGRLTLRDGATGNPVGNTLANATMPDVSADDTRVVFAQSAAAFPISSPGVATAGIAVAPIAGNSFGAATTIVPAQNGQDNYYPSFSPDGAFVAFNRSFDKPDPMNNNQITSDSYDQPDAAVMFVSASGGAVIDSASLNAEPGNSWPKFAPFTHHFGGDTIFWLTFSSRRAYGLHGGSNAQIWMAAVDEAQLQAGSDGAFPAFRLPFQDFDTGNHIPQWAEKVVRPPCTSSAADPCGAGQWCVDGQCVPH